VSRQTSDDIGMMRRRWGKRLASRAVSALLGLSCCCASSQSLRIERGSGLEHGRALEFEVLAAYSIPAKRLHSLPRDEAPGKSLRASDWASFSDAWRSFRLPGEAPPLDFSSKEVLFVATGEWAICGVLALTAVESTPDALVLRTPMMSNAYTCPPLRWKLELYSDIEPTRSFVLRVVAVPRQPAPVRVLRFGPTEGSSAARGPRAEPTQARGATVLIPAIGEVTLTELGDGSRVWVGRHLNGEITALAGDLPVPTAAVGGPRQGKPPATGIFVPSVWQPAARCYNSLFDEFGRPTFRSLPALDRYEFTLDPLDSKRLQIGRRRSGERGRLASRPCIPMDRWNYSAYPPLKSAPQVRFLSVGGQEDARHTVALGVEFPLQYPKLPAHNR